MLKYDERLRGSSMQRRLEEDEEEEEEEEEEIREIHALSPPRAPPAQHSRRSSSISMASTEAASSSMENFTSMSREFSALVLAGSTINSHTHNYNNTHVHVDDIERSGNLGRIREEEEETNPLAIVPDHNPLIGIGSVGSGSRGESDRVTVTTSSSVQRVKKEEVEAKISAWQNAKVAKINNRFKREDAVITAWETDHVHKATSSMRKVERKLEEKRARALEKMQNDIAKARRKGEERKASAEGKRGTKVARVLEIANLMRAVGKYPAKRSFF